jgi:hypothetical protein
VKWLVCCNAKNALVAAPTQAHIAMHKTPGATGADVRATGTLKTAPRRTRRGDLIMHSTTLAPLFAATTTADTEIKSIGRQAAGPQKSALWTRLYNSLIEARQAQAKVIVDRHMALQDDATLQVLNWTDAEIAKLRARHGTPR